MTELCNVASERAVLAGVFNHGVDAFVELEGNIDENTFTVDENKVLYKCICDAIKKSEKIGISEILSSAQSLNLSDYVSKKSVLEHINAVINTPINLDNVYHHAIKIRRLEFARKIQGELRDIYRSLNEVTGDESISSILSLAEKPISDICLSYMREEENTPKLIGDGLEEYIQHLMENKSDHIGLSTGFSAWDNSIGGGLRRKCVDLVAARTKAGKSVFADNVAIEISKNQGIPILMLDTEMSTEDHYHRLIANLAGVNVNDVGSGRFADDPNLTEKVLAAVQEVKSMPYSYINISGRPFEESLSIARRWIMKNVGYDENGRLKDCLIIYDYLKLMNSSEINNNMAEFQVLGFQITSLHNFCVQYDVPCLALVQANRDGITKESTDVVSGSDRLVWLCTSFSLLKEKGAEEIANDGIENGNRKLLTIVTRHGPGMQDEGYICLNMQGEYARMTEIGTVRSVANRNEENRRGIPDAEGNETGEYEDYVEDQGFPELL